MDDVSELRKREVETYFGVIAQGGSERRLKARSFHNLGEFDAGDYDALAETLRGAGARSSFSVLGRDAERYAGTVADLDADGHEIVLHGHRHVACDDIGPDLAHENLARGLDAVEDAAGVVPEGFIAPGQVVNRATMEAMVDLGMSWVLGRTDDAVPPELGFLEPAHPYDLVFLNEGADPAAAFDRIREQTEPGTAHLLHPNMLDYYGAGAEYADWLHETGPTTVGDVVESGEGVGIINDAMRPLRIV